MKKLFLFFLILGLSSCASVKEYEKVNINDPDMELSPRQICRLSLIHISEPTRRP